MKNLRQSSRGFGQSAVAGALTDLGWTLPSETAVARIGTLALIVGGALSLVILAF